MLRLSLFLHFTSHNANHGCYFCQYARTTPQGRSTTIPNPGWPGCCRPPTASEASRIPPADWAAVTAVHKVQPPPEVKALLDALLAPPASIARVQSSPKVGSTPLSPNQHSKSSSGGGGISTGGPKASPAATVSKASRGVNGSGSPKLGTAPATGAAPTSPVLAPPSEMRRSFSGRRDRDVSPAKVPAGGITRRSLDHESSTVGRRGSGALSLSPKRKPAPPTAASIGLAISNMSLNDATRPSIKRRGSNATHGSGGSADSGGNSRRNAADIDSGSPPRLIDVKNTPTPTRAPRKSPSTGNMKPSATSNKTPSTSPVISTRAPAAVPKVVSSALSDGSSTGSSTRSESTITSEGFTDYLSDESEAELQRAAEEKAAQLPHTYEEDEDFAKARKQLTGVGLRPPSHWTGRAATVGSRAGGSRAEHAYASAAGAFQQQRSLKA
jgi:hypothetical protein